MQQRRGAQRTGFPTGLSALVHPISSHAGRGLRRVQRAHGAACPSSNLQKYHESQAPAITRRSQPAAIVCGTALLTSQPLGYQTVVPALPMLLSADCWASLVTHLVPLFCARGGLCVQRLGKGPAWASSGCTSGFSLNPGATHLVSEAHPPLCLAGAISGCGGSLLPGRAARQSLALVHARTQPGCQTPNAISDRH